MISREKKISRLVDSKGIYFAQKTQAFLSLK